MPYFRNSSGKWFARGKGGTYAVNDGNPENDNDEFDEDHEQDLIDTSEEFYHEQN